MIPFENQEAIARREVAIDIERFKRKSRWAFVVLVVACICGGSLITVIPDTVIKALIATATIAFVIASIHDAVLWICLAHDYELNVEHHVLCYLSDYPSKDSL